jgi:hypothetical protein
MSNSYRAVPSVLQTSLRVFLDMLFSSPITNAKLLLNKFYVVRTVHFGMKLYNDQRNAQVFNLFIYLLLPYMFRAFF